MTTGDLAEAVAAGETDFQKLISSGKVDSTATVQEAAIEAHDDAAGTARVLVALDLTLTPASGEPKLERLRLVVLMDRTDQGWKASGLKSVAGA